MEVLVDRWILDGRMSIRDDTYHSIRDRYSR